MMLLSLARRIGLAMLLLLSSLVPALAVQSGGCVPTSGSVTGVEFAGDINAGFAALISSNSGPTAPTNDCSGVTIVGQVWWDTSGTYPVLRYWDGSQGLPIGSFDLNNHVFMPQSGGGVGTLTAGSTTDLCSVPQDYITISGTTAISSFGTSCAVGQSKKLAFTSATPITYNSGNILTDNSVSITTANGDQAEAVYLGGGVWRILNYRSAKGPLAFSSGVAGGTATAITLSQTSPSNFALSQGVRLTFIAANASAAGGTTLQIGSGPATTVEKLTASGLAPLTAGDIVNGQAVDVWYDGTYWELLSQSAIPAHQLDFFNLTSCPAGWHIADGTNGTMNALGRFPRAYDPNGTVDPTGTSVGNPEADQVGPLTIHGPLNNGSFAYAGGGGVQPSITGNNSETLTCVNCGTETRPRAAVALLCEHL